jgi:MFS family permease
MKTNILRALSEKSFSYLWIGEVFTQISINLFNFFAIIVVFELTKSNTAVSGVVLSFTIPAIIFGSIAGAYVDHWNKKHVLITTNLLRAILFFILAFNYHNVFIFYTISFVVALLTQFFIPAETPMVPLVVSKKHLLSANALFSMGIYGSILVAYVLSGPLIILLKPTKTLFFLAGMLVIGAIFIYFIKHKEKVKEIEDTSERINIIEDLRRTLNLISKTKQVSQSLFLLAMSQILILILATIAPGYAHQILGISVEEFPLLFVAPAAFGMVIGSTLLVNLFHSQSKEKVITAGVFLSGLTMMLLPYGSRVASRGFVHTINDYVPHIVEINILHIMVVLAFILGVANSFIFVPANTLLQEKTTDEVRGKIYGFLNTFVGALSLLPILIVGLLSDLINVGTAITVIGLCLIIFGIMRMFTK